MWLMREGILDSDSRDGEGQVGPGGCLWSLSLGGRGSGTSSQPSTKAAPLEGLRKVLVTCPSCAHTQFLLPPLGCPSPIPSLSSLCLAGRPITSPSDSSPPCSQSLAPSPGPEFCLLFSEFHQYLTTFGLSGCFICVQKLIN